MFKSAYNINMFKVLRDKPSKKLVSYVDRSNDFRILGDMICKEIDLETKKGRPVLVILDSIKQVEEFRQAYFPNAKIIIGVSPEDDRKALEIAGNAGVVTIATNAAGRGTDVILKGASEENGGLHVIISVLPRNRRILDQAIGRSGRQGQKGSATIYVSKNDGFYSNPVFKPGYENLLEIQTQFSNHIRENWPWLYEKPQEYTLDEIKYPFKTSYEKVLELAAQKIASSFQDANLLDQLNNCIIELLGDNEQSISDCILDMILASWGTFFTDIEQHIDYYESPLKCQQDYQRFLLELNEWIGEDSNCVLKALAKIVKKAPPVTLEEKLDGAVDFLEEPLEGYHEYIKSIKPGDNVWLNTFKGLGIGVADTVASLGEGIGQIIAHPLDTAQSLMQLMTPQGQQQFSQQLTQQFGESWEKDIVNGDALTRSKAFSRMTCEIALLAAPFIKGAGLAKGGEVAEAVNEFGKVGEAAEVINATGKTTIADVVNDVDKLSGWCMTEGGTNINGRWYSQHALERMAPDTLQIRAELSRRAEKFLTQQGLELGSDEYWTRFKKYVNPRNISPMVVEDAIKNGVRIPGNTANTFVCNTNDVKIIINSEGSVISIIPQ